MRRTVPSNAASLPEQGEYTHRTVREASVSGLACRHGEHLGWVEGWQLGVRHGYTVGTGNSVNLASRT